MSIDTPCQIKQSMNAAKINENKLSQVVAN